MLFITGQNQDKDACKIQNTFSEVATKPEISFSIHFHVSLPTNSNKSLLYSIKCNKCEPFTFTIFS